MLAFSLTFNVSVNVGEYNYWNIGSQVEPLTQGERYLAYQRCPLVIAGWKKAHSIITTLSYNTKQAEVKILLALIIITGNERCGNVLLGSDWYRYWE